MSTTTDSDLLFSQPDCLFFSDFGHFPELDDLSREYFLSNAINRDLLDELSCKDESKALLEPELNAFSISLEPLKEEREKQDNPFVSFIEQPQANTLDFVSTREPETYTPVHTTKCDSDSEVRSNMEEAVSSASILSIAPMSPDILNCMPLVDEMDIHEMSENITSSLPPLSPFGQGSITEELMGSSSTCPGTSSPDIMPSISPPVFQINSPVSSPSSTISTSDGNLLLSCMRGPDDIQLPNSSNLRLESDCMAVSSAISSQSDASASCRGAIPLHVMRESSPQFPSIQRSHSSHALGQFNAPGYCASSSEELVLTPRGGGLETPVQGFKSFEPYMQYQASDRSPLASPVASMRRVFSTGDLQTLNGMQISYGGNSASHLEHANAEEGGGLKIGHYTAEERKARLERYRQKRTERNFSRKIKYACRKTLADSRPRIRGRFARTDDVGDFISKENGASHDDEYDERDGLLMVNEKCNMAGNREVGYWNSMRMKAAM